MTENSCLWMMGDLVAGCEGSIGSMFVTGLVGHGRGFSVVVSTPCCTSSCSACLE